MLRFKAKITDPDLKPIKVRFDATASSDPTMSDAVEMTIPVIAPTIIRHESVAGTFTGPRFDAAAAMPKVWTPGHGQYTTTLSTSSWLPALERHPDDPRLPARLLRADHQQAALTYSLLANLMDYLPGTEARLASYNTIFQQGIQQIDSSLLSDGRLPYWPGETDGNDFVTCQACWALNEAANTGFEIPEGLADKLGAAVKTIATGSGDIDTRAFALFVLASLKAGDDLSGTAEDIYLHRENMDPDGRAMLAMALHQLNIMPTEKLQLLREIDKVIAPAAFKPATFSSVNRTEGICAMAFETIAPPNFTRREKEPRSAKPLHLLDSGSALSTPMTSWLSLPRMPEGITVIDEFEFSTEENLWLLLAFKSMLDAQPPDALAAPNPARRQSLEERRFRRVDFRHVRYSDGHVFRRHRPQ